MSKKKILNVVVIVVLVAAILGICLKANSRYETMTAELTAANNRIAELEAAAADTGAIDAANAKIAELETAAAAAAAELEAAQTRVAELETAAADTEAIDAANAQAAELQALVDLYKPFYDAQVIAEYDGGVVFLDDVLAQYEYIESMYTQYGISLVDYGMDTQVKQDAAQTLLQSAVLEAKAEELGLYNIDEATMTSLTEEAAANYETYIDSVKSYFTTDEATEDEIRADSIAYLESMGYTQDALLESMIASYVDEQLYNHITADVTVTDEELKASYDALVAEQESSFTDDRTYNTSRNSGETIAWNPEGYRAVKHVLIMFTDEQATAYDELTATLESLETELAAVQNPSEETTDEEATPRTVEEINADIAAAQADLDALYAELMPKAQEVVDKFNAGAAFADLIAEYNEDPGMATEPTATNGYAVAAASTTWDPAFTEGAMSIESVGGISAPVCGMNGVHVIYYESDVPAGAVAFEALADTLAVSTLETKMGEVYASTIDSWVAASNPVYHFDRLVG